MRGRAWTRIGVLTTVAFLAAACPDEEPEPDDPLARGANLFEANCASCHGPEGGGTAAGPPLVDELYTPERTPDEDIRRAIQQGVEQQNWEFGDMPAMPGLDDDEIDDIIAYVRELQAEAGLS